MRVRTPKMRMCVQWKWGKVARKTLTAKSTAARQRMCSAKVRRDWPRASRDCSERMMDAPTRKRKLGKTKSVRVKPFQGEWSSWV